MVLKTIEEKFDTEIVIKWIDHIENPCTTEVHGTTETMRKSYLIQAEKYVLPGLTNPFAKKLLQLTIDKYKE